MAKDRDVEKISSEVRKALYTIAILRIVVEKGPIHGYGIRKALSEISGGKLSPSESTVYETLKKLEKMGLVESFWGESPLGGPMRKYYRATERGREVLEEVLSELRPLIDALLSVYVGEVRGSG